MRPTPASDGEMKTTDVTTDGHPYQPAATSSSFNYPAPENSGQSSSSGEPILAAEEPAHANRDFYDMSGNKTLIVFNHYQYDQWRMKNFAQPSIRSGTYEDVENLERTFRNLGFSVHTHNDLTHNEIKKRIADVCEMDHSASSCVALAVLTHGFDDHLCAADTMYPVADIVCPLGAVPSLREKPKLFFIQACREGHIVRESLHTGKVAFPLAFDCLLLYSTFEDYISHRSETHGSWLVQALCEMVRAHHRSMDLVKMTRLVNREVAMKHSVWGKQMSVSEDTFFKSLML